MQETTFYGLTIQWELDTGDERDSTRRAGIHDAEVTHYGEFIDKHGSEDWSLFVADPVKWAGDNYQDKLDAIARGEDQ